MGGLRREYRSAVREAHADATRERLVDAAYQRLKTTRPVDLSYADVAADAEVSVRTVYRHFPQPEDLFAAVSRKLFAHAFDRPERMAETVAELIDALERTHALLEQDPAVFRVIFAVPSRSPFDQPNTFARLFAAQVARLSDDDRRSAFALIDLLGSPYAWDVMHHNWGLPTKRSVRAVVVALQALFDYLERNPGALAPENPPPELDRRGDHHGNE